MKKSLKSVFMFVCLMLSIFITSTTAEVASVPTLSQISATIFVGKKVTLKVKNTTKKITWKTSNKKIATVTSKGVVTGVKAGTAKITATVSKKKLTCKVTVKNADAQAIELTTNGSNGGDFLAGESGLKVDFKLDNTSTAVKAKILDMDEEVVYTKTFSKCKAKKAYTFTWNGKDKSGDYAEEGFYTVKIVAGSKETNSETIYFYVENEFDGGDGSETKPYEVSNIEQLEAVAKHNGMYFVQTADIDFNYGSFVSLFTYDAPFTGTYDGNNYSIKNIINNSDAQHYGIFRAIGKGSTIKNLKADGCSYKGNYRVGILVGFNWGTITNCVVENCIVSSTKADVGAVCGLSEGTVKECKVANNVINGQYESAGAICGWNSGVIRACSSSGDNVYASGNNVGGIAGGNVGTIMGCTVENDKISTGNYCVGGIAGYSKGTISNCEVYDNQNLISGNYKGGIIGQNQGSNANNVYYGTLPQVGN